MPTILVKPDLKSHPFWRSALDRLGVSCTVRETTDTALPGDVTILPQKTCLIAVPSDTLPKVAADGSTAGDATPYDSCRWLRTLATTANTPAADLPTTVLLVYPHNSHLDETSFAKRHLDETVQSLIARHDLPLTTCLSMARPSSAADLITSIAMATSTPAGSRNLNSSSRSNLYSWQGGGPGYPAELIRLMAETSTPLIDNRGRRDRAAEETMMHDVFRSHASLADCASRPHDNYAIFWSRPAIT